MTLPRIHLLVSTSLAVIATAGVSMLLADDDTDASKGHDPNVIIETPNEPPVDPGRSILVDEVPDRPKRRRPPKMIVEPESVPVQPSSPKILIEENSPPPVPQGQAPTRLPPVNDLSTQHEIVPHRLDGEYSIRKEREQDPVLSDGVATPRPPVHERRIDPQETRPENLQAEPQVRPARPSDPGLIHEPVQPVAPTITSPRVPREHRPPTPPGVGLRELNASGPSSGHSVEILAPPIPDRIDPIAENPSPPSVPYIPALPADLETDTPRRPIQQPPVTSPEVIAVPIDQPEMVVPSIDPTTRVIVEPNQAEHPARPGATAAEIHRSSFVGWQPWWGESIHTEQFLNGCTKTGVSLDRLSRTALSNSPAMDMARLGDLMHGNTGTSNARSRMSDQLLKIAQNYWQMYRTRGAIAIEQRNYLLSLDILRQINVQDNGVSTPLSVLAEATAQRRKSTVESLRTELRELQNQLAFLVGDSHMHRDVELIPQDTPCTTAVHCQQDADYQTALAHRPEMQVAQEQFSRTQSSSHARVCVEPGLCRSTVLSTPTPPSRDQQLQQMQSQRQLDWVADRVRLEVNNAILGLQGSHSQLELAHNAAYKAAEEVFIIEQRRWLFSGTQRAATLYLRELTSAQDRLAGAEQDYLSAMAKYNSAIVELRRAQGILLMPEGR